MQDIWQIITSAYLGSYHYFVKLVTQPIIDGRLNGFYMLILISLLIWGLELLMPWRKKQKAIRKDFWLDAFYMFFNFYFFNILLYAALSSVSVKALGQVLSPLGYQGGHLIDFSTLPWWLNILCYFIIADFVQWCVHVLLHRVPFLWRFHKVHHSVREMGFAAHLRYHFMETIVYQSFKYISLAMLFGFDLRDAFYIYMFQIVIGHLNHANVGWDYGPLKYIFNNPKMHIWHHVKALPKTHPYGINFGISLSIWDYIFGTNHVPHSGRDIELGFEEIESYPKGFLAQIIEPFTRKK
jgi:sterol desaturase/sphingolipid hydroxylase (fatty acid hydroxylase superfamily)